MEYGCIGEHLKHSFSREIHNSISDYKYELKEIPKDMLCEFITSGDFKAINVTIPYKEAVIPYLDYIDNMAKEIGSVNTIVNKDGKLYGYNTDFYGMSMLIAHAGVNLNGKKVAILGTGGTSKTANAVAKSLFAREVIIVSRTKNKLTITYEELYENHKDTDIIINTTPLGMFPDNYSLPVDLSFFPNLSGVIDAVYNPVKTLLVRKAQAGGIPAEGGLYMLVAQGVLASEIFLDKKYDKEILDKTYEKIKRQKENIVLTGMPSSGKTIIGKALAQKLDRNFYDTDELIRQQFGKDASEIIASQGEEAFRQIESDVVKEISKVTGAVIATGGGVVLKEENVRALQQNGRIYFLDRPLELLLPTKDRPLTSTRETLEAKHKERYPIYEKYADVKINASGDVNTIINTITGDFEK